MKVFILGIAAALFALLLGCTERPQIKWLQGQWQGNLSWEHDTTNYPIRITIERSNQRHHLEYQSLNCKVSLVVDSLAEGYARFSESVEQEQPECSPFGSGRYVFSQIDYYGLEVLHVEYYPEGEEQLWIAQVVRAKAE